MALTTALTILCKAHQTMEVDTLQFTVHIHKSVHISEALHSNYNNFKWIIKKQEIRNLVQKK